MPCFPEATAPLEAIDVYRRLEAHSWALYGPEEDAPPPEAFGTCTVTGGRIVAADGTPVGELGCGLRILVPGIRDDVGLELGARGQDVLDRSPGHPPLTCFPNGPDQARCRFDRAEDTDTDSTTYVVAGALGEDVLAGDAALAFFAPRPVVEIGFSVWCH